MQKLVKPAKVRETSVPLHRRHFDVLPRHVSSMPKSILLVAYSGRICGTALEGRSGDRRALRHSTTSYNSATSFETVYLGPLFCRITGQPDGTGGKFTSSTHSTYMPHSKQFDSAVFFFRRCLSYLYRVYGRSRMDGGSGDFLAFVAFSRSESWLGI